MFQWFKKTTTSSPTIVEWDTTTASTATSTGDWWDTHKIWGPPTTPSYIPAPVTTADFNNSTDVLIRNIISMIMQNKIQQAEEVFNRLKIHLLNEGWSEESLSKTFEFMYRLSDPSAGSVQDIEI